MGRKERDKTDKPTTEESRQAMPVENGNDDIISKNPPNQTNRAPDLRRRALIAGLATTPVLLSLTNRSALGQNIDCSLLSSIILGGSVGGLPNGWDNKNADYLEHYYNTHCTADGPRGTGNATGNSGATTNGTGNSNGNASGN